MKLYNSDKFARCFMLTMAKLGYLFNVSLCYVIMYDNSNDDGNNKDAENVFEQIFSSIYLFIFWIILTSYLILHLNFLYYFLGHGNNIHCLAKAINSLAGAMFTVLGHGDVEMRLKEFLAVWHNIFWCFLETGFNWLFFVSLAYIIKSSQVGSGDWERCY